MVDLKDKDSQIPQGRAQDESLRQALLRLTSSHYETLYEDIEALRTSLGQFGSRLAVSDENFNERDDALRSLLDDAHARLSRLETSLSSFDSSLREEIAHQTSKLRGDLAALEKQFSNPQVIAGKISPILVPVISERVRQERDAFAQAVAPVIGPAIRHQIRAAREDIIDSLYPLIGQIIGKAIAEAMRELMRNIDARLRRGLNLGSRLRGLVARLRGVSEAELLLRESLPFRIQHVFLIHRRSGILLKHLSGLNEEVKDQDLISGMLTAIRDFVHDSFGDAERELEEIAYGKERILLESGPQAYLAVVLEGIEPPGYSAQIENVIHKINLEFEGELHAFSGEIDRLPDFTPTLSPLLTLDQEVFQETFQGKAMSRKQKLGVAGFIAGMLVVFALVVFGCVFTIRLWPLAFPGRTPKPTQTALPIVRTTMTQVPRPTATLTPTQSPNPTIIPSFSPTSTSVPSNTPSPTPRTGTLAGNLYVRGGPSTRSQVLGVALAGEKLIILKQEGDWYYITQSPGELPSLEGWIWGGFLITE